MSGCFYMGTREKMFEVKSPAVNMPSSKIGFSSEINFLNGGADVRRSTAAAKRYTMTWGLMSRDEARIVLDLADGIYGSGAIYWHDPFAADRNVLPQWWASPMQGAIDGLPLNADRRGVEVETPANALDLPIKSIEYDVVLGTTRTVWVPIPQGYSAWVGAYGQDGTGGRLEATPTVNATVDGPNVALTFLDVTDNSRFTNVFSSNDYDGLKISLGGSGTVTLTGIMVQVLKNGKVPAPGKFISGQGNSGCSFVSQPSYTPYSAALDKVGLTADLVETGGWAE
jgi:hypothetical protein